MIRVRLTVVIAVAALLIPSLVGGPQDLSWAAPMAMKTEVTVALTTDATTLDPARPTVTNDTVIANYFYDYLLWRTVDGKLAPRLAESWRNVNETTWEVKLRRGVKFHNGEPLTADAVKFTYDRVLDPANKIPGRGQISTIQEVKVIDPLTVHFITKAPDPTLASATLFRQAIIPPQYFKQVGEAQFALKPNGTGPFVFKEWVKDGRIVAEANPNYWGGAPKVKRVTFRPIPEYATRVALLRTGEVDLIPAVVPDQAEAIGRDKGIRIVTTPTLRTMFLIMRPDRPPLDDKRVRQALNYAVNKESIVKNLLRGFGVVAKSQVVGPVFFGYNPDMKPYPFDQEKAKQLIAEAGYPNGFTIDLWTPAGRYTLDKEIAQVISAQLARVGVQARVTPFEWGVYAKAQLEKKLNSLNLFAFAGPYDAAGIYHSLFVTNQPWGVGPYWSRPEIDRAVDRARSSLDSKVRQESLYRAAAMIREEAPVLFLHHLVEIYAVRDGVNFVARPDELVDLFSAGTIVK
jgi:peptide/nickel transport system substrate-binding protein